QPAHLSLSHSAQDQPLPPNLRTPHSRPHQRGLWSALPAVHSAMLFTQVSSDLLLLNSAFGQPLSLAGAWQWFDGPLFMHMLDAVDAQQARKTTAATSPRGDVEWSELLLRDPGLLELFLALHPVAVPVDAVSRSDDVVRVAQAARVWERIKSMPLFV
ncbi:MAG: hypothetical protein SGPRY_012341, partial [Prymnesium sp.]